MITIARSKTENNTLNYQLRVAKILAKGYSSRTTKRQIIPLNIIKHQFNIKSATAKDDKPKYATASKPTANNQPRSITCDTTNTNILKPHETTTKQNHGTQREHTIDHNTMQITEVYS